MLIVNIFKVPWNKKYTQEEMCKLSGLSKATVSKMWNCESNDYRISSIEKMSKFLGCKAMDIIVEVPDEK